MLRFWLDRGVDGFRVDALRQWIKDEQCRDNPRTPSSHPSQGTYESLLPVYTTDRPEIHPIIARICQVLDAYSGCDSSLSSELLPRAAGRTVRRQRRERVPPGYPKGVFGDCAPAGLALEWRLTFLSQVGVRAEDDVVGNGCTPVDVRARLDLRLVRRCKRC